MKDVNKDVMEAAKKGDGAGLKDLLLLPGCKRAFRDSEGMTALMYAASNGHASCVSILLPVSDALAKDKHGRTASELARNEGHASLAAFIDAYALALSEMSEIGSLVGPGSTRKKASLRV